MNDMRMKSAILSVAATLAATTASLAAAAPAQATAPDAMAAPSCPSGYVCLYEGFNGNGRQVRVPALGSDSDFRSGGYVAGFNDTMSSWQNNSGYAYCWYFNTNYGHPTRVMLPHGATRVINLTADEDNKASSITPCT